MRSVIAGLSILGAQVNPATAGYSGCYWLSPCACIGYEHGYYGDWCQEAKSVTLPSCGLISNL